MHELINMQPIVSVIVPFIGFNERVKECIESLKRQKYRNVEIIAISDKADLGMEGVKSIFNPKLNGVAKKRNAGAKAADGDILFFLDSDCRAGEDTIKKIVGMFGKIDADGITCKPVAPKDANTVDYATLLEQEDRYDLVGEAYVNIAATTCFAVKKKAFDAVGGFVDYIPGKAMGEDWDFARRMRELGFKIFHTNKIAVEHNHVSKSLWDYLKGQYFRAMYRVAYKKRYAKYTDEYATASMFVTSTILLGIPSILRLRKKHKNMRLLALVPIAFLRNFAWALGFANGFLLGKK